MTRQRHHFTPDPDIVDWQGDSRYGLCCNLPRGNDVHQVPPVQAETARLEARRLGEGKDGG